ncbi:hypothetical protein BGX29_009424 [Mortierella sp. GBA35]|nr:hypothetical protein BGX29_009424 [Mortierella sp. GBA35]
MKLTLSAIVLALAASQAAAVVPVPVKECTRSYVVEPGTPDCVAFATKFGITFPDLLKWNDKLRPDCANLDVGEPLCVSVTPGNCCLRENPHNVKVPQPGDPPATPVWDPAPALKGPGATTSGAPVVPTGVPTTSGAPGNGTRTATTPGASGKPTSSAATGATSTGAAGVTPSAKTDAKSAAMSNKGSVVLGAAGLLLSAVYLL